MTVGRTNASAGGGGGGGASKTIYPTGSVTSTILYNIPTGTLWVLQGPNVMVVSSGPVNSAQSPGTRCTGTYTTSIINNVYVLSSSTTKLTFQYFSSSSLTTGTVNLSACILTVYE